ncbi:hypothetical protein ABZS96_40150 [Streptomyces avermitilis]|uniref:hypothetical protein n=1 Tax=Streptomyces avermitilis TaxID=33903 RepID=UPI0033BCD29A
MTARPPGNPVGPPPPSGLARIWALSALACNAAINDGTATAHRRLNARAPRRAHHPRR